MRCRDRGAATLLIYLLFLLLSPPRAVAENIFTWPPENPNAVLYIPAGSPATLSWTCDFHFLNLRAFQRRSDRTYSWEDLLLNVSYTPGKGGYAWSAETNKGLPPSDSMHFEITEASNGQSLNPFNSGIFHVSNGSSISTSSLFSSESPATASSIPSTSAVPTRGPILTSALVASSSSSSASSSVLSFVQEREDGTRKLGFGLGLGLGLPLLLIILGLAVFFVLKRKTASSPRQPQEATARPGTSPPHYGHEYGVPRTQEFDAQAAVVEVPAVISYEFPGSEVRHELSAEVAGTSASMFLPNPSQSRTS